SESEELREEQAVPEANDSENLKSSSSKQGKSEASQSKAVQPDSPSAKPDGAEESQEILERAQKIEALKESLQDEDERQAWLDRSAEAERLAQKASSFELYAAPPLKLLQLEEKIRQSPEQEEEIRLLGATLEKTLNDFGIDAKVVNYTSGPTISRFEIVPGPGIKVSRIVNLADDIALALAATAVRIEAPIPGKSAVGIEIPNKQTRAVLLRGILEDKRFKENKAPLLAALGRDIQGEPIFCDLAKMPHLLIAGATGSGKSVCINSILISLLYRTGPENLRLLMIDPKVVELSVYNGIPHLLQPVVTNPKKATGVLRWAVDEMSRRYNLFATAGVRDFRSFNAWLASGKRLDDPKLSNEKLPYIVLVIDELSDLMATSANEVEESISRLTAMARAAGIHLIIATQRPSVDVITGVIKANIPSRIAFAVASQVDSRTILDLAGAEKLLGKGDMLYAPQSSAKSLRGQGSFVTDGEVEAVVSYLKHNYGEQYDEAVGLAIDKADQGSATASSGGSGDSEDYDELLADAMQICLDNKYASISLLQRRLNVGYPRAARMVDQLHDLGAIGPFEGSKPRTIAVKDIDEFHAKLNGLEEK
ncbi:MAG: DNA translocase FtsK, partial [Eubacteriales bacterium]|nr:DNA translocase FtsK [Eubacteriales bacterium]